MIPYDELALYKNKRNFNETPEPSGKKIKKKSHKKPVFVVQKHDASHLHYDFRLEIDGTLKSWAIPKGPSTNPHEKRLAIETEDHPIEYARFEGIIPEGNYGAGTVVIWDKGTFDNIKTHDNNPVPLNNSYHNGQIEVFLHGKKLHGGYALIKTDQDNKWLLIKMRDEYADETINIIETQPESIVSHKTIEQLNTQNQKQKNSKKKVQKKQ